MSILLLRYGVEIFFGILVYAALISLVSAVVTAVDKSRAAQGGMRRVPENTLLLLAALGGSAAMLMTMLMIRHKTRHAKFMLGLPIILLFQAVILLFLARALGEL